MPKKKKPAEEMNLKEVEEVLNDNQKAFARYFLFGWEEETTDEDGNTKVIKQRMGNATKSYAMAYGKDHIADENLCSTNAWRLQRNAKIKRYKELLLEAAGFNDTDMDARLQDIAYNGKGSDSMAALKLYGQLKGRITNKVEHSGQITQGFTEDEQELLEKFKGLDAGTLENILDAIGSEGDSESGDTSSEK